MTKPHLSVCLAVYNEAKNLPRCLRSVKDLADELVIVDGGSTDATVKIAQQYQARIIASDNPPMFHKNKQKAVEACTGRWILQLDADEELSPQLAQEIDRVINRKHSSDGYYLKRSNFFLGRFLTKGGAYPDPVIRLFKNGQGHFPCQSVHEQIAVNGRVDTLENELLHWADPSFGRYLQRWNRYTDLIADQITTLSVANFFQFFVWLPAKTFISIYFRHKGFVDGWQGLVWAGMSAFRFPVAYLKAIEYHHA